MTRGEAFYRAIEALEQESCEDAVGMEEELDFVQPKKTVGKLISVEVLDNIRAEIKALSPEPTAFDVVDGNPIKDAVWETLSDVLKIIDKYKDKAESEGEG